MLQMPVAVSWISTHRLLRDLGMRFRYSAGPKGICKDDQIAGIRNERR